MESGIKGDPLRILISPLNNIRLIGEAQPEYIFLQNHILQVVLDNNCKLNILKLHIDCIGLEHYLVNIAVVAE